MARKSRWLMVLLSFLTLSCSIERNENLIDKYRSEIMNIEREFAELVKEKGLKVGFLTYASEDAVLNRGNQLIKGKKAIQEYYENYKYPNARLEWEPEFIEVSSSGDLAYTYGHYTFEVTGEAGQMIKDKGIFHTVWKRESSGEWRYVWD